MSVWMVETLIATTLLMALVMLLRRPVARWLGAGAAYCLWAVPFARMLLPALPGDVASPSPLHVAVDQAGLPDLLTVAPMAQVATDTAFPWLEVGIGLWFAGMLAFLIIQAVGYARFRRHMLTGATPIGEEGRIRLITSPHASGPLAFGVFQPFIVLPADFALRYDALEQEMAIAHERAHHAHGDLAANMVALALLAIHWCNPIAWIAYRAYRADQETACDARVLALYGQDQAHIYGRAILKAAGGRQFAAACHLTRITTLKGRLLMLSRHEISLQRISWGMAAVAIVTATGLALTASGSRAAQQMAAISDTVETADFARLSNLVAQPAAATVPQTVDAWPETPTAPTAARIDAEMAAAPPPAPTAPIVPAADMIAPVAPVPPMPAVPPVTVREEKNAITITHADGRVERHHIPTEAEIRRMVPRVDVRNGCEGDQTVSKRESVDSDGRRTIRVRICEAQIEAQAHRAARAGLVTARAQVARTAHMTDRIRADVLRDLDDEIAKMDGQGD
ncbi:M56 family metallopeptidase [Sphingobium sp.]|uniref:M56 family metallopeptidase n=1 Tax=Sphingobium sp. TaxID=1912891 RepID=UPI002600F7B4|nr:M56 family metallopeptidase [Sphingobium sp.]